MAKPSLTEEDGIDGDLVRSALILFPALFAFLMLPSCNRQPGELVEIQQVRSGNHVLTLLNDTGAVKQHSNKFTLEIRDAESSPLANVTNVQIQATMRMPRSARMSGTLR